MSGKPAFRMLIPDYYSDPCLACHGSPAGETDVTGFPKEGGALGELVGANRIQYEKDAPIRFCTRCCRHTTSTA